MKIAILGPYSQECGIAGYAQTIRAGFEKNGHEVRILGNYPYAPLVVPDDNKVFRCFHVEMRDKQVEMDYTGALNFIKDCDVLLVQYEASLYPRIQFTEFLSKVRYLLKCRIAVVFHSTCIWPEFPWHFIHCAIAHDEGIYRCIPNPKIVIRHGSENYPDTTPASNRLTLGIKDNFTFGSFGLGRVRYAITIPAVVKLGYQYLVSSPESEKYYIMSVLDKLTSEERSLVYYYPTFVPKDELIRRIQACEAVLIDYPPVGASVCSGTARIALGARRRIVVSRTNWFADLVDKDFVFVLPEDQDVMQEMTHLKAIVNTIQIEGYAIKPSQEKYVTECSWNNITRDEFIPLFTKLLERK